MAEHFYWPRTTLILIGIVAFFILCFSLLTEKFFTLQNMLDLAESYAVTGIFAFGYWWH